MGRLKPGDVVRIWSFYVSGTGRTGETLWGVVGTIKVNSEQADIDIFFGPEEAQQESTLDYEDEFDRPPPSKVPNYASVALAKYRLTGERTTVMPSPSFSWTHADAD